MVKIADGRYDMPRTLLYSKTQHVFLDKSKKICGLDQIGYAFLKNPTELKILAKNSILIGDPFAIITTEEGNITLNSPCSGSIKRIFPNALEKIVCDTFENGIIEFDNIIEIDPKLITGDEVETWANEEIIVLHNNKYSFKIVVIGNSSVGKTAIKIRFTENYFKQNLTPTLGIDFGSKELIFKSANKEESILKENALFIKLVLWDTSGSSEYDMVRGMHYREARGAIICFDLNDIESFESLDKWYEELDENLGNLPILLIGNKKDLERQISFEEAEKYANDKGFTYIECSAKTGENIEELFRKFAYDLFLKEKHINFIV